MRDRRQKSLQIPVMSTCNLANPINELALESVDAKETITFAGHPK